LAILGFYIANSFVKAGRPAQAHSVWSYSYIAMFGVVGFGYRRFLYSSSGEEWSQEQQIHFTSPLEITVIDFLWSNIFKTLVAMSCILFPALFGPQLKWFWRSGKTYADQVKLWNDFVSNWIFGVSLGSLGFLLYMFLLNDAVGRDYFVDGHFGYFTPLLAFYFFQAMCLFMFSFILLVPQPPAKN